MGLSLIYSSTSWSPTSPCYAEIECHHIIATVLIIRPLQGDINQHEVGRPLQGAEADAPQQRTNSAHTRIYYMAGPELATRAKRAARGCGNEDGGSDSGDIEDARRYY